MEADKILTWIAIFAFVFQCSYVLLTKSTYTYRTKMYINASYYLIANLILIPAIYDTVSDLLVISKISILMLIAFIVLTLTATSLINKKLPIRKEILERKEAPFFFNFTELFITNKVLDIVFQQFMVLWLITIFTTSGVSNLQTIISFGVIFLVFHLFTFFRHKEFSLFFILSSLIGGFLLPYLVLYHSIELPYLIALHLSTYIIGRVVYGYLLSDKGN